MTLPALPLLRRELFGLARRGQFFLLRAGYATLLLVVLLVAAFSWLTELDGQTSFWADRQLAPPALARLSSRFFGLFLIVQFVAAILAAPLLSAGSFSEERRRRTLDDLLTTALTSLEIVAGKYVARLTLLVLLLAAGLPVLAILQLVGGVEPRLLLAGFVGSAATMASLSALSLLLSAKNRSTVMTVYETYLFFGGYLVFSTIGWTASSVSSSTGLEWSYAGNVFAHLPALLRALETGELGPALIASTIHYVLFHVMAAIVFVCAAAFLLRRGFRQQAEPEFPPVYLIVVPKEAVTLPESPPIRPVPFDPPWFDEERPLLWKERYFSSPRSEPPESFLFGCSMAIVLTFVMVAAFTSLVFLVAALFVSTGVANIVVRVLGTLFASGLLLAIALRAAGSISREREGQTWDSLLTTPLSATRILREKWLGSIYRGGSLVWVLAIIWGLGTLGGGVSILALPLLMAAGVALVSFVSAVGLCFSFVSRSTTRARAGTLLILLGLSALPLLADTLTALSPPALLWKLAFSNEEFLEFRWDRPHPLALLPLNLLMVVGYAGAAYGILRWLRRNFERITGRIE